MNSLVKILSDLRRGFWSFLLLLAFPHPSPLEGSLCPSLPTPRYARGFSILSSPEGTQLEIKVPGPAGGRVSRIYTLLPAEEGSPVPKGSLRIPPRRVVVLTTTVLPAFGELSALERIVAVQEGRWVEDPEIRHRIEGGAILSLGENFDLETLLTLRPDLVISYAVGDPAFDRGYRIESLGIPVLYIQEFEEGSPLGRAEWVKVIGCVLGKGAEAEELFQRIATLYERERIQKVENPPRVLLLSHFQGIWYFSSRSGYLAQLIRDGGGEPLGGSSPLTGKSADKEEVYRLGKEAEIWILTQFAWEVPPLLTPPFPSLPALREGRVYALKGRAFWERGVLHPEEILREVIAIVQGKPLPEDARYFTRVPLGGR